MIQSVPTIAAVIVPGMRISFTYNGQHVIGTVKHATKINNSRIEVSLRLPGTHYGLTVHTLGSEKRIMLDLGYMADGFIEAGDHWDLGVNSV